MSDLISRADAIEAVLTYFIPRSHTGERGEHEEDFVRTIFKALPSAELTLQTPQTYGKSINPSNAEVVEDLISRADAIRWVKTECNPYGKPTLDYDSCLKVIEHLKKMPSELQSAEAEQGEWVKDYEKNIYKCSVCGCEEVVPTCMGEPTIWKYCPNCGATMKGGNE